MNPKTKQFRDYALLNKGETKDLMVLLSKGVAIPINAPYFRLANHFPVGCDPEFMAAQRGLPVGASNMGFRTGHAYGCDGSGTQMELRAHQNESVVKVVASILNTLRVLNCNLPLPEITFFTGGYPLGVACGGHVHFGRKAPLREEALISLAALTNLLEASKLMPGSSERAMLTRYGRSADCVRQQKYGYEFRTMCSWLWSPRFAHFVLTLAKLSVLDLDCWRDEEKLLNKSAYFYLRAERILGFYRYMDDDAALASMTLKHIASIKLNMGEPFNTAWGLSTRDRNADPLLRPPATIQPDGAAILEAYKSILTGQPPADREVKFQSLVNTKVLKLPMLTGPRMWLPHSGTWPIGPFVKPRGLEMRVDFTPAGGRLYLSRGVAALMSDEDRRLLLNSVIDHSRYMDNGLRVVVEGAKTLRWLASNPILPFGHHLRVDAAFCEKWLRRAKVLGLL